jgi:sialate O-acetylesterase
LKSLFQLAPIFQSHMVFQSGKPIRIFGTCAKNIELKLEFLDRCIKLRSIGDTFLFELPPMPVVTDGFEVLLTAKKETIVLEDCLIGDVFLVAGGSNMKMTIEESYENNPDPDPMIRFFDVPRIPYPEATLEFPTLYPFEPNWEKATGKALMKQTAIGFHIAEFIAYDQKVPIGIVSATYDEASIFAFIGMHELFAVERFAKYSESYKQEMAKYPTAAAYNLAYAKEAMRLMEYNGLIHKHQFEGVAHHRAVEIASENLRFRLPMGPKHPSRPHGLFDTMLKPLAGTMFKAVVFYQGEADLSNIDFYEDALKTMVKSWRKLFEDPTLPFVHVQLAGFANPIPNGLSLAVFRDAQRRTISYTEGIYLATALDLGESDQMIPREKVGIAKRIANVLFERVYRKGKNQLAPAYFSHQITATSIIIYTEYNNLNLVSRSRNNMGFFASFDGETFRLLTKVKLLANQVILEGAQTAKEIRYCFENAPVCDIYTTNDLPLLPFRIILD